MGPVSDLIRQQPVICAPTGDQPGHWVHDRRSTSFCPSCRFACRDHRLDLSDYYCVFQLPIYDAYSCPVHETRWSSAAEGAALAHLAHSLEHRGLLFPFAVLLTRVSGFQDPIQQRLCVRCPARK